jgi:hypothetical protein
VLVLVLLLLLQGCVVMPVLPPRLVVVQSRVLLGDRPGMYMGGTIYLAPGADWNVFEHELNHHRFGSMGETPR